jgi:hypothetical protein
LEDVWNTNLLAKTKSATTELKSIEDLKKRLPAIAKQTDKHGEFLRKLTYYVSAYVSNRIPEIS